jgi:hypothetical protein
MQVSNKRFYAAQASGIKASGTRLLYILFPDQIVF